MTNKIITTFLMGIFFIYSPEAFSSGVVVVDSLNIMSDPRTTALGGGLTADISGLPSVSLNNPAGLTGVKRSLISFNNIALYESMRYNSVSVAVPTNYGTIGGSILYFNYGDIKGYDAFFNRIDVPGSYDMMGLMSYAFPINTSVPVEKEYGSIGMNLKLIQNKLHYYSAEAIALDVGGVFAVPFISNLSMGVAYKNLGSNMKFVSESSPLPSSLNFGLVYKNRALKDLLISLDYFNPDNESVYYSAGIGLAPVYFLSLRVGWKQDTDSLLSNLSAGFGLVFGDISLDYAYIAAKYISDSHHLGMNIAMGGMFKLENASDHFLNEHFHIAMEYYYRGDYIESRQKLEEILAVYPEHHDSNIFLEKIIKAIDNSEEIKEKKAKVWLKKGKKASIRKDYVTASKYFKQVLEINPENSSAIAEMSLVSKKLEEVKGINNRIENGKLISRLWKRGVKYYLRGEFVKSKDKFFEILEIDPDNSNAGKYLVEVDNQLAKIAASQLNEMYDKASGYYKKENYEEAIKYFEVVIIAAPHRLDAKDFVIKCKEKIEERKKQVRLKGLAIEQGKYRGEMESFYNKALRFYELGKYESALKYFEKSNEVATAYHFEKYIGNNSNYISNLKIKLAEQNYKTGYDNFRNNRFEEAAEYYRRAVQYDSEHIVAKLELERVNKMLAKRYYEQGMAYFARSEMEKAREMLKKSLFFEPDKEESIRALERSK